MDYKLTLEVCCADLHSVRAAIEGGAHRVELCQALGLDGLTPSAGMIETAVGMGIPVQVLIRPREGDFVYDEDEVLCMQRDIRHAKRLGVHGVVIGALKPDGSIDSETVRRLVSEAEGLSITFHRAFDVCAQPLEALEQIIALGCHRLLTSGQAPTAEQGIPFLRKLVEQAAGRISIMPGAGVNPQNAYRILSETGAREIHGSLRSSGHTDPEQVRAVVKAIVQPAWLA
ncbi:MAG: copper homeostasis protein CutC [Bacteroidaceae bacterium]|nr:copper homeostasis protein CutC [Bacteroidaceae bacterium]